MRPALNLLAERRLAEVLREPAGGVPCEFQDFPRIEGRRPDETAREHHPSRVLGRKAIAESDVAHLV